MVRRRWFYLTLGCLVVSVLVNLFVAGVVVGRLSSGPAGLMMGGGIPHEARRYIRQEFAADRAEILRAIVRWRAAQSAVRLAVRTEPYDQAAVEASLTELRSASTALQARLHARLAIAMAKAPPEVRARIPERTWMMRGLDRRLDRARRQNRWLQ
ncbi:MAG: periplasmic heavy metal sensor [Pseudomonadota bacterium]